METGALDGCAALGELTQAEKEAIARLGRYVRFETGERIVADGAPASGFYVVVEGRVEARKGRRHLAQHGPGAVLGEMALFNRNVRTSELRALEPCLLFFIPLAPFCGLILEDDPAAVKV